MTGELNSTLQDSETDYTSLKYMLKLSAPMIVTNISFTVMQFVDRFMVSRLGTEALAAVLPAGMASFLPASFALGIITSVNTFVSQSFGRGDKKACASYFWQMIYMGFIYSVLVLVALWPMAHWIFKTMGYESEVVRMEVVYFRIMLYCQIAAIFIWTSSQFFMGIHRPIITMYAALVSQTVNVAANYVLIFGKFGFPQMGIKGAALGTFIGILVGAIIKMGMFLTGDINAIFKSRHTLHIDTSKMAGLIKVGFPAGLGLMINIAFWSMILLTLVSRFGKEASAATTAVFACINVSVMPIIGIGTALTAAVGKAIGEGRKNIAVKQTSVCMRVGLIYMVLIGLCFYVFRYNLMEFWSSDDKVIKIGVKLLLCAALFQGFDAATLIYSGSLRGAGDTVWLASISAACSILVLGLGGIFMLFFFPELGALGPWIAATANIIVAGLANRWRFKSKRWMNIDIFKRRAVGIPVEVEATIE